MPAESEAVNQVTWNLFFFVLLPPEIPIERQMIGGDQRLPCPVQDELVQAERAVVIDVVEVQHRQYARIAAPSRCAG